MSRALLSPTAQSVLTSALLSGERCFVVARKLFSLGLRYQRARLVAREISAFGFAVVDWGVKGYRIELDEPLVAWSLVQAHAASPVTKIVRRPYSEQIPEYARLSGPSALAIITGMSPPATRRLAVFQEGGREFLSQLCASGCGVRFDEVELWNVPPAALAVGTRHVDPLSLFLTLREVMEPGGLTLVQRSILDLWPPSGSQVRETGHYRTR